MMKKILTVIIFLAMLEISALAQDDDSVPYWPYPEQPQATQQQTTQPAPKTTTTTKKAPAKKTTTTKKTTTKKATPAKPSSLEQGIALMKQEKYEAARPYLLKAIQENKNNANAWYWYGVYHEKIGGYHQAQYFYSKAVTLDPTIEQLSRVVFYPEDSEKTPLWDPKRPARVYPVQTTALNGATSVPAGVSSFPTAPNDPQTPKVPVYVPPEAGASPIDGDTWAASVYVPPSAGEVVATTTNATTTERQYLQFSMTRTQTETTEPEINAASFNGESPVYTPPAPAKKAAAAKTSTQKKTTTTTKKQPAKTPTRVVKKSSSTTTKKAAAAPTTTRRVSQDVRPAQPTRQTPPAPPEQTVTPTPTPSEHIEPMTPQYPERQQIQAETQRDYIPPVGQAVPDYGTINDAPIPPVGQNNL